MLNSVRRSFIERGPSTSPELQQSAPASPSPVVDHDAGCPLFNQQTSDVPRELNRLDPLDRLPSGLLQVQANLHQSLSCSLAATGRLVVLFDSQHCLSLPFSAKPCNPIYVQGLCQTRIGTLFGCRLLSFCNLHSNNTQRFWHWHSLILSGSSRRL